MRVAWGVWTPPPGLHIRSYLLVSVTDERISLRWINFQKKFKIITPYSPGLPSQPALILSVWAPHRSPELRAVQMPFREHHSSVIEGSPPCPQCLILPAFFGTKKPAFLQITPSCFSYLTITFLVHIIEIFGSTVISPFLTYIGPKLFHYSIKHEACKSKTYSVHCSYKTEIWHFEEEK